MYTGNSFVASTSYLDNRPSTYDFLKPNGFRFVLENYPQVSYTCQSVTLPSIGLGSGVHSTPFIDYPIVGEKVSFGDLDINFIVSEDMSNYIELYNWMTALGDFKDYSKIQEFIENRKNRITPSSIDKKDNDHVKYSDATLVILNSSYNANINIKFTDAFPVDLSPLTFDTTVTNIQYFTCRASFKFRMFEVEPL